MKIYGWTPPFMQGQIQAGMQSAQGSLLLELPNIRYDRRETQIELFSDSKISFSLGALSDSGY